jgi:hypothetical protein
VVENFIHIVNWLFASPVMAQSHEVLPPRIEMIFGPIESIFELLLPIGALIAVAMLIYGGYMWILSGGDPSRKQLAQGTLTWAIVGLVFLFLIRAILIVILNIFGA